MSRPTNDDQNWSDSALSGPILAEIGRGRPKLVESTQAMRGNKPQDAPGDVFDQFAGFNLSKAIAATSTSEIVLEFFVAASAALSRSACVS